MKQLQDFQVPHFNKTLLGIFLLAFGFSISLDAKANTLTGEISGSVFVDENINGINDETSVNSLENITSVSAVLVYAYDETGAVADRTFTNAIGNYTLKQLNPNETYRIEFRNGNDIISSTAAVETITAKVGTEKASQVNYAVVKNTSIDGQDSEKTVSTASNKTEIFNQLHIKSSFSYDAFINYANISAANEYFTSTRSDNVQSLAAGIWNNEGRVPFQTTDNQVAQGTPIPATARVFASALTEKSVNARSSFSTSENAAAVGAAFVVLGSDVSEACFCLANATSTEPGQFVNILSVTTDTPGESWQIISASGIQQGLTSPGVEADLNAYEIGEPVMTVPFDIGGETESLFEETTNGESIYSFAGVTLDGAAFSVEVTNGSDTVLIEGASCNYNDQIIQGQTGVCASSVTSYCVEDNLGSTYEWNVSGGGVIMTSADEACIEVLWDPAAGGPYTVSVIQTNENLCLNPASIDVNVGVPGGAMACIAKANISLSVDCDLEVTPDLVLETPITGDQVYTVIVTDPDGNMLPEPIITSEYVGLEMEVKIMDVCSGNSCWTTITVFDKMKPTVDAQDITIACSVDPDLPYPLGIDNCDSNPTVELISETIEPLTCDDNFTTEITRVFIATDSEGNVSAPTEQVIYLERINLDSIVFPVDRTVIDGNPVFCQQFDLDDEGNPAPSTAGVPTYRGQSLYPYQDQFCSFGIDYNDLIVEGNSCVTKIMRTWTAYEWWCGESIIETVIQEINIADQLDPEFEVPADIVVTTNVAECFATVDLPAIIPTDDCSSTFEIDIQYPGGFLNNSNGGAVDFELGVNEVIYTVYDGCLNSVSQSFTVTVEDNTMPVMVCDGNTVISLNANGTAYAPASVFNDGTIEDCTDLTFEVLRMDNGSACGELEFQFGEFVNFCCADVGQVVQVILKATDENNNSNTCVVDVVVQDKNAPVITVPADLTIECTAEYDPENLEITFGTASATDNCLNTTITEVSSINISDCNTGTIVRTFTASDGNGEAVDTQTITVVNSAVFDLTDIIWPLDYTTDESCNVDGLQPEDLQAPFNLPILTPDACDMIDLGFQDQTFTTSDDACFKIIRTWMVMDMCNLQQDGSPTMFMHDQTIVVTNSVDPIIVTSCDSISSSLNADCDEGFISLTSSATDDCTAEENIRQSYFIDVFNDGSFEEIETGNGGTILVEGVYPLGTHRIVYEFEDRCGNSATCTQMFTIFNEIPPLAKCQDLAVELTPADTDGDNILDAEQAFLDVELVGGESEAACGGTYTLSYDVEGDSTIAMFDCFNLGTNIVTVYVTDDLSGLQSSCTATVIVQDNNDVEICPSPEDCIVWPDTNLLVDFCVTDLQPESILSETEILEPCVCGDFDVTFTDVDLSSAGDACAEIERTWLVTFNCFVLPLEYTFVQTITQLNAFAPVITSCPDTTFAMSIDGSCFAPVTIGTPAFDSSCSFGVTITNDSDFSNSSSGSASGSYPVGVTEVTYTLTDECGNASVCNVVVVVNDSGAPICNTQDITISIPTVDGSVTIEDDAVDDNSVDDCGTIVSYSTTPNTFSCNELGENTVVMTVTDNSGNSSTCTATVTVVDEVAPICNAGSLTLTLFTDTTVSITGEELDNGSEDLCGTIASYEAVPNVFSCADVGENDVVLIVTDNNGNTSSCVGTVTILDEVAPLCESMDATIILDANGNYTLDASEVDGGSMDVCGDQVSLSVMPDFFTCDNLGDNIVTLTVTDLAGNTSECTATVTVTETIAPICSAGTANITLFSNTTVTIPASFVDNGSMDECGVIVSRTITPNMFGCSDIGMNSVILTVTDDSGNSSTCEGFVNVSDNIAPICEVQDITVMIGADGLAIVDPLDIDNGSSDECGEIVSYTVEPDTFTCVDEGINTVVFTVTDNSGNTCTSSANVTVESTDSLLCVAQDITVFLDENGEVGISPEDVDGGSMAPCGSTVTLSLDINAFFCDDSQQNPNSVLLTVTDDMTGETDTCTALVTVLDTLSPIVTCPADLTFTCDDDLTDPAIFGEVLFEDNCPGSLMQDTIVIDERNTCGIGTITRRYIALDLSGNVDSCEQIITIEVGENAFTEDSITWPMTPFDVVDCSSTDPLDLMSFPILDTMNLSCFNISVDFEDVSTGMGTMCMDTIERTWTVIDSCQLDGTGAGIFTFLQTLYIDDSSSPVIFGLNADTTVFTSFTTCDIFVDLSAAEVEDCTLNLEVSNNSPFADDQNSLDASGTYPLGTTEFSLFATDACGNSDTLNYAVTVEDNVNPVVECIKVFTDITANGTVTVFPEDFIGTMSDNCTDSVNLDVSFILDWEEGDDDISDNPLPSSLTFDCDQIGISVVFVVFIDESGNFSVCGAQVAVSDPNDFCDGGTPAGLVVDGTVNTINGQPVEGTIMSIEGTSDYETSVSSDGLYAFPSVPLFTSGNISAYNNENMLFGVTTLDLLLIQNHIMNLNTITSPYDLIAADVDHSDYISGNDLVTLQKLILGEITEIDNNTSFRFVDSNYEFLDNTNPFITNFPEKAEFTNLSNAIAQNFVGIKVGDVNGSYVNQSGSDGPNQIDIHSRSLHTLMLETNEVNSVDGFVEIPIYSGNFESLQALEMTINSDNRMVEIIPGSIDINESEYRTSQFGRKLKVSWVNNAPIDVRSGDLIFTIVVKSNVDLVPSDVITLSPAVNEFYNDIYDIAQLRFANDANEVHQAKAVLNQNAPNPWSNETMISFEMVTDGDYTLSFFDIDGKLLTQITGYANKGYNEVQVSKREMGIQSGVIVYEFTSGNRKLVKRMVLME